MLSAQDSIPFERMFPDGICRVEVKFYSKTIQFQDINYQLSQSEDKDAIFDGWCEFLNYFDASVKFQFSFVNSAANKETYRDRIAIPLRGDEDDSLRKTSSSAGTTASSRTSTLRSALRQMDTRRPNRVWSASRRTYSTTSASSASRLSHWMGARGSR